MVYRLGEKSGIEVVMMTKQVRDFNLQVALKEQQKLDKVTTRLNKAMDAYNEKLKEIEEKDILIASLQKQLGKRPQIDKRLVAQIVAYPTHPPSINPIIEIPGTPRTSKYYTHEDLKEDIESNSN